MRKNFGKQTWLYPMPVLIIATYNEDGTPNAMNAAWGGICSENMIGICVAENHRTTANIFRNKAFTVSVGTAGQLTACDYVGLVSGNKEADKFSKAGFHVLKASQVNAPLIEELPMGLECEFVSYDKATNFMMARIVNVSADESILDAEGHILPDRLQPLLFDPCSHHYLVAGPKAGNAFEDGKKLK